MALRTTVFLLTLNILFFALVSSAPSPSSTCPKFGIQFGVCGDFLNGLLNGIGFGTPPSVPCCSLIAGLVDFEAAACICTAIKANLLGVSVDVPLSLSLVLNNCGKDVPSTFKCA